MNFFLYEYACARRAEGATAPFRSEGLAMLQAVSEDFARLPGASVSLLLNSELAASFSGFRVIECDADEEASQFARLTAEADYTLVIAPELDDILECRCRWVEEAGGRLLGPSANVVRQVGDKLELAARWHRAGVPTPPTQLLSRSDSPASVPAVIKPQRGAGCTATFLARSASEFEECVCLSRRQYSGPLLVQPLMTGQPASVAFLAGARGYLPLLPASQCISVDKRLAYRGGVLPLPPVLAQRALNLAGRALEPLGGLRGYIGIDLVLGPAGDGSSDCAIEINPRLTTSYLGLRRLATANLAAVWLALVLGTEPPAFSWLAGPVRFAPGSSSEAAGPEPVGR